MPQRLATEQHSGFIQLPPGLVLPAGINSALETLPRPPVHPVKWDFLDGPRAGPVHGRGVISTVGMDVGALMDELPDLFLRRRVLDLLDDHPDILPDDGTHALPAALAAAYMGKILAVKHPCVFQHLQMPVKLRRPLAGRQPLDPGDLRFDLLPRHQIFSLQALQLAPTQAGPSAETDQLVIVGLGKMLVPHTLPPAPCDVLSLSLWRREIILVLRRYAVELPQRLRLQLHRPCGKALIHSRLQPLIGILLCAFQRGAFRVVLLDVADKIFDVLEIVFVGGKGKYFILRRSVLHRFLFALAKGLHTGQPVIRLLVQILRVGFVFSAHRKTPFRLGIGIQ